MKKDKKISSIILNIATVVLVVCTIFYFITKNFIYIKICFIVIMVETFLSLVIGILFPIIKEYKAKKRKKEIENITDL